MWNRPEATNTSRPAGAPPAPAPPQGPRPDQRPTARIGKSIVITGDVISAEDLTIDGRVEGAIDLDDCRLTIGVGGAVQAALTAHTIIIHGAVTGNVTATKTIEIGETGSVDGDLKAPRIAVREGAVLRGRIDTVAEAQPKKVNRFPVAV